MADRSNQQPLEPEDPALAIAARHALHDEELVAAFATDADEADDAARAKTLIERCTACRDLHADLVSIGGAIRAVGNAATVAAMQPAPRDFRLSIETANRIRPGSVVIRFRDRVRATFASLSRPLGVSMASLGIVGLLLGTLTLGGFANLGIAPGDGAEGVGSPNGPGQTQDAQPAATPAAGQLTGGAGAPLESRRLSFDAQATAGSNTAAPGIASPIVENGSESGPLASSGPSVPALIVGGSAILLIGGIALIVIGSRRREPVPGR